MTAVIARRSVCVLQEHANYKRSHVFFVKIRGLEVLGFILKKYLRAHTLLSLCS